jgi:cysteinyl-tRNA synthetase
MPDAMPRPSEHIPEILSAIGKLNELGYLYKVEGDSGGMYYDTSMFKGYGALTKMSFDQLQKAIISGYRIERPDGIRNPTDFAVWRFADPRFREFVWDAEYGRGFPGWHIECSVMSMKYLGEHFDIHCGGIDHIPIHHTNEIAQSEAITGKKFVNYWVHVAFVNVDGKKMAKSLGNIYTIDDLVKKGFNPLSYRYMLLGVHYRRQFNFTFEKLKKAEEGLNAVYAFLQRVSEVGEGKSTVEDSGFTKKVEEERENFFKAVEDDLNVPVALSRMHTLINEVSNRITANMLSKEEAKLVLEAFVDFDSVLGLDFASYTSRSKLTEVIDGLIEEREKARKSHEFKRADEIRTKLLDEYGIILEDTPSGVKWYSKKGKDRHST